MRVSLTAQLRTLEERRAPGREEKHKITHVSPSSIPPSPGLNSKTRTKVEFTRELQSNPRSTNHFDSPSPSRWLRAAGVQRKKLLSGNLVGLIGAITGR